MKKSTFRYWFISVLVLLTFSCKTTKPTTTEENNTKDSSRTEIATDHKKEINKAVADSLAKWIPLIKTGDSNCDSICNEKCNELLESLNFYKQSGDNNYKLLFDKHKRLLSFTANLEETISEFKSKKETKERYFLKTVKITKKVPVQYIPFWVKILAWIGGITSLFLAWRFGRIFI